MIPGITNIDLLSVGVALAANVILGSVIIFAKPKNATNVLFLLQTLILSIWSAANYLSYQNRDPEIALVLVRLVMFFAVPNSIIFLILMDTFPEEKLRMGKKILWSLIVIGAGTMVVTLTPLVFPSVEFISDEVAPKPVVGPGMAIFVPVAVLSIVFGAILLIRRYIKSSGTEKLQLRFLLAGVVSMFTLIILFNFIFPAVLGNSRFVPLSAVFTLPFVFFTAYAIIKYRLLNLRVISSEILVFVLAIVTFIEVILSDNAGVLLFRISVFLLVLAFGILLIRSVLREVKQREELQALTQQLKTANEKLKVLDKARAEFITIASHQLRTPPATIKWYLAAIIAGDFGPVSSEVMEALKKTEFSNNSMISLIDDMLNVPRIERGKIEFVFEKTDVLPLVEGTVEQLQPLAQLKNLQLIYKKPTGKIPPIMADKEKLRQVVNNLIDNALKYTKQGHVMVAVKKDQGDLVVSVSDTGKGVDPKEAGKLFTKFGRGEGSQNFSTGLGLGLYLAKVVIEQHKGKIWVESEGEGKGSTFAFRVPINSGLKSPSSLVDLTSRRYSG